MKRISVCLLAVLAVAGWYLYSQPQNAAPLRPLPEPGVQSLRVLFGVSDTAARPWDGNVSVQGGEVIALRSWRPHPTDAISGTSSWKLATRKGINFARRAWEQQPLVPPESYYHLPGLIIDVRGAAAQLSFTTNNGNFSVRPADIALGRPRTELNGAVSIDRVPTAQNLTPSASYQHDFPSVSAGKSGEIWVAWVAYKDKASEVLARRFDGKAWGEPQPVSGKPGDVYQVKLGRDQAGHLWAVWSEQISGNWDLYAKRHEGAGWGAAERLTSNPQPDFAQQLTPDSQGNLWLVWQSFRAGKSDIYARRFDGNAWSAEECVSESGANDWSPAIAADSKGRVYVAWDTYEKDNYDILMRTYSSGKWSAVQPVAATPKFEAHVSLACDAQNRLWLAWNESGYQWGKDTGFLVKREGTRLYQWRTLNVAVYAGGAWEQPAAEFDSSLPHELQGYNDLPQLAADSSGRVWVLFRHRTLRVRDTVSETPAHRAAWENYATTLQGDRWLSPVFLPSSAGRTEALGSLTAAPQAGLLAAWPCDNRDYEEFLFGRSEVYTASIPPLPSDSPPPKLSPRVLYELKANPVHRTEAEDLARIRGYEIRSEGKTYRIYRGDTHRHTEFSMDGNNDGTLMENYRYAIDAAGMDYLGISEHNALGGPDVDYVNWLLQQRVDLFLAPGTFTPLFAYERSVGYPNGHRNVIFAKRGNPTLPIPPSEARGKSGAAALYDYLKKYDGIAISHTSASNMGTDWRDNDPQVEPLVEIYQGDRVSNEYEGAPKAAHTKEPASAPGGFRPAGYVWNAWAKGYKLGVQVSSDHLSTHISYACTLATEFTREGLLDAMKKRHSYGATDNIVLDYRLQAGGREYLQGDIVKAPGDFRLSVKVLGTAPIRQIDIVRNNTFVHNRQNLGPDAGFTYVDNQPLSGESYYYVRVWQVDDQIAWSSPIWITRP